MHHNFERLVEVMKRLRQPDGCPWDRKQTYDSLQKHIVEEAHELVDALAHRQEEGLEPVVEECGDLAMQVVFLGCMGEERGDFTLEQVFGAVCDKLIRRHPHVFGDQKAGTDREALQRWEAVKAEERKGTDRGLFSGVPRSLPSLIKAYRLQEKAASVGFDWPPDDLAPVVAKVDEELAEMKAELQTGGVGLEGELGDLLFAVVNLIRLAGFDPEKALNRTNEKFIRRLEQVESRVKAQGTWSDCPLEQLEYWWNEAKAGEEAAL